MESLEIFKGIPLFHDLTAPELHKLLGICQKVQARAGEEVFRAGSPGEALYVIREGRVAVVKPGVEESEEVVAELGAGEIFGEMALFGKESRSATIRATEETRLFRIKRDYFEKLMEEDHELALKIYRRINMILTDRLRETTDRLAVANRVIRAASLKKSGQ
jgi:CRP-like cAMP-binding protein